MTSSCGAPSKCVRERKGEGGHTDCLAQPSTHSFLNLVAHLPNTLSSLIFFITSQSPAGNVQIRMCRSKKKDTHVVGWCSDTDAMIGMWILAYLKMTQYHHNMYKSPASHLTQSSFVWFLAWDYKLKGGFSSWLSFAPSLRFAPSLSLTWSPTLYQSAIDL